MRRKIGYIIVLLLAGITGMQAEIAPEIIEVMKKSDEVLANPEGVKMEMEAKVSMAIFSLNVQIVSLEKGNKSKITSNASMMGKTIYTEEGCDGTKSWEYKKSIVRCERDSLIIYPVTDKESDYSVNMSTYNEYDGAKMKLKNGVYEIVLKEPKDEESPNKTIVRIDAETYLPLSIQMKESGATVTMNIKKVSFGVPDAALVFDVANYPGAVVVEN